MAIKSQNKINTEFSMIAVANIVFLLLIFFILTSTLVSPNAIKLLLPTGSGQIISKQTTTVYINDSNQFFINKTPATYQNMQQVLSQSLIGQTEGVIVIRADQNVPVEYVATVIDAVTQMNKLMKTSHKVILATKPKE
jgi:biopolymer transport protein ExbD